MHANPVIVDETPAVESYEDEVYPKKAASRPDEFAEDSHPRNWPIYYWVGGGVVLIVFLAGYLHFSGRF